MQDLYFICPVCGEEVPRKAKSCPECGACEKSGWGADTHLDGLDLPDADYTSGRPLEEDSHWKAPGPSKMWVIAAAIVFVALLWLLFRGGW